MEKKITKEQKKELALKYNIDLLVLETVIKIESSGSGYGASGDIKIQFEPYWFNKFTGIRVPNGVETQAKEWEAYNRACLVDVISAMKSTSWGLGQIMGFNHKLAGFDNVLAMVDSFKESEKNQLEGMLVFITSQPGMVKALKGKDWASFARLYNGEQYKTFKYDIKLKQTYEDLCLVK